MALGELSKALSHLGFQVEVRELQVLLNNIDHDHNREVDAEELAELIELLEREQGDDAKWKAMFRRFDIDGNGVIDADELADLMHALSGAHLESEEIHALMEDFDT